MSCDWISGKGTGRITPKMCIPSEWHWRYQRMPKILESASLILGEKRRNETTLESRKMLLLPKSGVSPQILDISERVKEPCGPET